MGRPAINLSGQKFGRLVVANLSDRRDKGGDAWVWCVCDCGNNIEVRGYSLRRGHTNSCGCLASELASKRRKASVVSPHKRIEKMYIPVTETGCWLWLGSTTDYGYGVFFLGDRIMVAHRAMLILTGVTVGDDMEVCHKCDTPSCVNPAHMFVGTRSQNQMDCANKERLGIKGRVIGDYSIASDDTQREDGSHHKSRKYTQASQAHPGANRL